jgi:aminopeptidase N
LGYQNPDDALNANTYPKAAWVLHMLRAELGDEVFFRGVRNYYGTHAGSTVRTADFRESMEKTSRRELGWFFDQWLDRPDCPELDFEWTERGVIVTQTQDAAPFQFLLPLRWTAEEGWIHDETFRITETTTTLELDGAPISLPEVDPHVKLLFRPAG